MPINGSGGGGGGGGGGGSASTAKSSTDPLAPAEWSAITPEPNDAATEFTIDTPYKAGTLRVYANGLLDVRAQETTPGAGTFTMSSPPPLGIQLEAIYEPA